MTEMAKKQKKQDTHDQQEIKNEKKAKGENQIANVENPPVEELSEDELDQVNGSLGDIIIVKTYDKSSPTLFH
jgi:hypothetical protein